MPMSELERRLLKELEKAKTGEEIRAVVMQLPDGETDQSMELDDLSPSTTGPQTTSQSST